MAAQESGTGNHGSQGKTRFGGLIKDFVHDMKVFRKDSFRHRRGLRGEQDKAKQLPPSEASIHTTEEAPVAGPRSLFQDTPHVRTLSVRVIVNFGEPLNYSHSQDYEASSSLQPTEELCEGLLHRVDHCSKELITRRDSSALERTGPDGLAKPLRYEIQVQILRNEIGGAGTDVWATRVVRSYQRQPLGTESAREIILSTHHMIGLFLRHHDEAFVWKDGPVREDSSQEQKTFPYRTGRVQPLASVPRSPFIEKQQDFEAIPGYTVNFSITSQNHRRVPANWHDTVEINSRQLSPLTHATAESLFFDACYAVDGVFRSERKAFEAEHASCTNQNACSHCKPHDGDGIEILVSVKNNLGPLFDNLERAIYARTNIFWKDHVEDCIDFVEKVRTALEQVCQDTDELMSDINDFEFSIVELRGRGWSIDEPLMFTRGPETFISRRSVEAVLDRLQTGVADTLRGNAIAVRMTARKRGHFILDKTLVSREPIGKSANKRQSAAKSKAYVLDRLTQRIERDIEMVCKDTCSIVGREEEPAQANSVAGTISSKDYPSMRTALTSSKRMSILTAPSMVQTADTHDSPTGALESEGSELSVKSEPLITSYISPGQWLRVTRDPETGLRRFPLVPQSWAAPEADFVHDDSLLRARSTRALSTLSASNEKSTTTHKRTPSDSDASNNEQEPGGVSLTYPHHYERERSHTEASTISTRPQTPSLEFGGSPSIRSSLLVTPKIHEPLTSNEVEILQRFIPDIEDRGYKGTESVDTYMRRLFTPIRSTSSPPLRLSLRDITAPVPIRHIEAVDQRNRPDVIKSEDIIPNEPNSRPEVFTAKEDSSSLPVATGLDMHGDDNSDSALKKAESPKETEFFSQSKPDFTFSSPLAATPPGNSPDSAEAQEQIQQQTPQKSSLQLLPQQNRTPNPKSPDTEKETTIAVSRPTTPVTPVRPGLAALQHHRTSFGSAGYIGSFHDQRFYGMGLRQALMGASTPPPRTFSPLRHEAGAAEPGRPGTAI